MVNKDVPMMKQVDAILSHKKVVRESSLSVLKCSIVDIS